MAEIVVITEGTVGIGRAFARRFARQGAKIAVLARGLDDLRETVVDLATRGASAALAIPCDVMDPAMVARAAHRIEQELGPIDVWIDAEPWEARRARACGRAVRIGSVAAAVVLLAFVLVELVAR